MFGKKFFRVTLILVVLVAMSVVVAQAAGGGTSTISEPVVIQVPSEPVSIHVLGRGDGNIIAQLFPGEEITLTYQVVNTALVSYVVEIRPVFIEDPVPKYYGNSTDWLEYQFENMEGSQAMPDGSAVHVLVAPDSTTDVHFRIGIKKDAPFDLETSFEMHLRRTDCEASEGCLWE